MARVTILHAAAAEVAGAVAALRRSGHTVRVRPPAGGDALRALLDPLPDVFVVDLDRGPARARALATWLRGRKASRGVPLVWAGGDEAAVRDARALLPDAVAVPWRRIRGGVRDALRHPATTPVVPGTMAGYSGTPLPRKLGMKAGITVVLLGAPDGFEATLGPLPDGVRPRRRAAGPPAPLVILFARDRAALARRFAAAARAVAPGGSLWIAWPKRTSGLAGDLGQSDVRAWGLERGWVDFRIAAIDATWSGLRFARRRA